MKTLADIKHIAVLGAGTMGPGIAQTYAMGGYKVTMWTRSESTREKAIASLKTQLDTFEEEGMLHESKEEILGRIHFALTVAEAVKDADYIQETIVEKKDAKIDLYNQLAELIGPEVIVASNTSALNIFEIVPKKLLPQQVIAHGYAPPHLIPLVEVVKSEEAPQEFADITEALLKKCGKTPVVMKKFVQGYIINRLQQCIQGECFNLIDNGYCDAKAIDDACKASFIPRAMVLGICKRIDFGGIDMTANNIRNKSYTFPNYDTMPKCMQEHLDKNELGIKTGKGFYDYTGEDIEALKAKRDKQLFEVFRVAAKFNSDPV